MLHLPAVGAAVGAVVVVVAVLEATSAANIDSSFPSVRVSLIDASFVHCFLTRTFLDAILSVPVFLVLLL
jgi:hypothetical protein